MEKVNIGGNLEDKFYRYKREKVILSFKKNWTIIQNLDRIIDSLDCVSGGKSYREKMKERMVKLLAKTLGCQVRGNSLGGIYTIDRIENVIQSFISSYLICPQCSNPEWTSKSGCRACGHTIKKQSVCEIAEEKESPLDIKIGLLIEKLYAIKGSQNLIDKLWGVDSEKELEKIEMFINKMI